MTWEPTHVQFTVLRARGLVGKLKGKTSAKVTDVFVSIGLGKEKFQTSTIKYGGKVQDSVEWFEECDLAIPSMDMEVDVNVMNRGLLSDEFVGFVSVPLHQYSVYERPKSQWLELKHKPSKIPDGRYRGEIEVRLTFHVKSREETSPGGLKGKRTGSIKSLVSAVGDKFKFTRSRSLRGDGNQTFSTPQPQKLGKKKASTKTTQYSGSIAPTTNSVQFEAVDLYVPEQCWRENDFEEEALGDGNFARSYSLTSDKRRNNRDFKSKSLMNLPGEHSMTLPNPRRAKQRPSLDDSALGPSRSTRSSRSSRSSVTSQEGYLENMFRKECEVDERMNDVYEEGIEEESEGEYDAPKRKSAQVFNDSIEDESSSESTESLTESEEEITLPKVKLKENTSGRNSVDISALERKRSSGEVGMNGIHDLNADLTSLASEYRTAGSNVEETVDESTHEDIEGDIDPTEFIDPSEYTSELDRVIAREQSRLNSHGSSVGVSSTHSSSSSVSYNGKSAAERAFERGSSDSMPDTRRRISPKSEFSFTGVSQISNDDSKSVQRRKKKSYTAGGRRYTVQGLEHMSTHRSAPDIRNSRPTYSREESVPEDLMAVYRNMNREELVQLVVTHKAQLIRKDQYIKDLEGYIDSLLVRVMESSPRILQNL